MPLLAIFTSFLILFPLMERHLARFRCWRSWHVRLKPWYDSFGGPYKDNYRSRTGVLLLARCALALVVAFVNEPLVNISGLAWTSLFLVSLLCTFQVYTTFLLNALEIIYLVCLLLMALFSTPDYNRLQAAQEKIVLWIVLSSMIFVFFYHIYQVIKPWKNLYRLRKKKNTPEPELAIDSPAKTYTVASTLVTLSQNSDLREPLLGTEPKQLN